MKRLFNHLILVALACCASFVVTAVAADEPVHERVGVEKFHQLWKQDKLKVLDVRTQFECEDGHLPGALNIDFYGKDFKAQVGKLDKNKPWLVHCRSGGRSAAACKIMKKLGFTKLYDLAPGMNGWKKAGKPVTIGPVKQSR